MIAPTIHLGGTHGPDLMQQWQDAAAAMLAAQNALKAASPHPRDYVGTEGSINYRVAMSEWETMLLKLTGIRNEIADVRRDLYEQMAARNHTPVRAVPPDVAQEGTTTVELNRDEVASILCALRLWQMGDIGCFHCEGADHFEDADPLTAEGVDALCERLNCGQGIE